VPRLGGLQGIKHLHDELQAQAMEWTSPQV
jgi:hypothetical protein